MQEYLELRSRLCDLYPTSGDWRRVAHDSELDTHQLVLEAKPIIAWSNILGALRTQQRMITFRAFLEHENNELLPLLDAYAAALQSCPVSHVQIRRSKGRETDSDDAITQFSLDVANRIKRNFRAVKASPYARPDPSAPRERSFYIVEPTAVFNSVAASDGELYPLSYELNFKTRVLNDSVPFEVSLVWNSSCDRKLFGVFQHEKRLEAYLEALEEPLAKRLATDFVRINERGHLQVGFRRRLNWSADESELEDSADDGFGSESAAEDIRRLKIHCEELLRTMIRECIKIINDPDAQAPLSDRTAKSISAYLRHRRYSAPKVFAVDDHASAANAQFANACQAAWDSQDLYWVFAEILGANFGLYALAPAATSVKDKRYLFYSMKQDQEADIDLLLRMFGDRPDEQKRKDEVDQQEGDRKTFVTGGFGHWLLTRRVSPTPLAVILHYAPAFDQALPPWKARAFVVYDKPLGFAISVSRKDKSQVIVNKLRNSAMGLQGIEDRLAAIKAQVETIPEGHYMREIRSVLFLPIAGNPGVTFQILSRQKLIIGESLQLSDSETLCLSYDELFAMRLGVESFREQLVQWYGDINRLGPAQPQP